MAQSDVVPKSSEWGLWLKWVLGTAVGWPLGLRLVLILEYDILGYAVLVFFPVLFAPLGAVVGIMQWLVLRRRFYRAGWWVLASAIGCALGGALGSVMAVVVGGAIGPGTLAGIDQAWGVPLVLILVSFPVGAALGTAQWLVLRRWVSRGGWWVLASSLSVGGGMSVALQLNNLAAFISSGAVVAITTGSLLVWLMRHRVGDLHPRRMNPILRRVEQE